MLLASAETRPANITVDAAWRITGISSHFKSEVGDRVLDVMFHEEKSAHPVPHDFGAVLNANTLDSVIEQQRAAQEEYRQSRSQEMASLRSLIPGLPIVVYHRIAQGDIGDEDPSTICGHSLRRWLEIC